MTPPGRPPGSDELLAHAGFLRALARGLVADEARADDLVQETFVAALERPPAGGGSLRAWLATVARHLAANTARGEARRTRREARAARPEQQPSNDAALERLELSRRLSEAVLELREPYRTTVYLRYHEGLGPQAIAARQGVPVKTVKTRLARALAELRQRLDDRSEGRGTWMPALLALARPRGAETALAAPLAASIGGGLVVKKLALAAAVLVVLALAWQGVRVGAVWPRERAAAGAVPELVGIPTAGAAPAPVAPAPEAAAPREPLPAIAPPAATTGDLVVQLVWRDDGSPIAGLCLDALCLDDPAPRRLREHVVTDEGGRARYEDLPAGRVRLHTATGFGEDAEVVAGVERQVRFEVASGHVVEGLVLDPEGGPVAGAEIWVQYGRDPERSHRIARSRADGRFLLRGLGHRFHFGARAAGWRPSLMIEASELPVGPTGAREVTLELEPRGGGAAGRVLDPDGQPVAGARVVIGPAGGHIVDLPSGLRAEAPRPTRLVTDERGEFAQLGDLEAGAQDVHVAARGFAVWSGEVRVHEGSRAWIEVQLQRPVRVAGRVVDEGGAPVPRAEVVASRERGVEVFSDPFPVVKTTSDEQGLFLLDWVAPGEQELTARVPERDRLGRARAVVSCAPGEQREVELVLELGATIRGRVVDREGRPLEGWSVRGECRGWVEDRESGVMRSANLRRSDRTDAAGAFLLANLSAEGATLEQGLTLLVAAPGEIPVPPRAELRGVQPGADDVELVVENATTVPARLRGRLLDASGVAPQDVSVTVWDAAGSAGLFAELDPQTGVFEHESTLPGLFDVRVLRGGNTLVSSGPHELFAGETTDVGLITLGTPGRVEVILSGVPEAQLEHVRLTLTGARSADEDLEREGGSYRSRPIAPGTWILHVQSEPWFVADRVIEVREGATTRLEVEAVRGFEVDLAFELADPAAEWSRVEIEIRDEGDAVVRRGGPWPPTRLNDGVLRMYGLSLPVGRFTALARTDAGQQAFGTLEIVDALSARGPYRFALR